MRFGFVGLGVALLLVVGCGKTPDPDQLYDVAKVAYQAKNGMEVGKAVAAMGPVAYASVLTARCIEGNVQEQCIEALNVLAVAAVVLEGEGSGVAGAMEMLKSAVILDRLLAIETDILFQLYGTNAPRDDTTKAQLQNQLALVRAEMDRFTPRTGRGNE